MFRKLDLFPSSDKCVELLSLLGLLAGADLNYRSAEYMSPTPSTVNQNV
jgi:hypothetical protein